MGIFSDIGSALGTGADFIQGKRDRKQARLQFNIQQHHTIENRVKDARRAGIHPLYALGVSGVGSPTFMSGAGQSDLGSKLGEIGERLDSARKGEPQPTEMQKAQLKAVNASASRDEAAAANTLSAMRRAEIDFNSRPTLNMQTGGVPEGLIEPKKSEIISAQKGSPGTTAGKKPAFMEVIIGKNADGSPKTMKLPYSDEGPAESMEGLGAIGLTILKNMGFLDDKTPAEIKRIRERLRKSSPQRYGLSR